MVEKDIGSPAVSDFSWGNIVVGDLGRFKDVILYPGGAREWDWRDSGTNHQDGIQPPAVELLLQAGARQVILSRGVLGRLSINRTTIELLENSPVTYHIHRTKKAIELYNRLRLDHPVGALIHSTC